jgi:DNA-binding LacI/PurR family transcriptional regulator
MWSAALRSDLVEHGDLDRDSGEMAMARLLATAHEIDAVFAASDAMAAGAMWALQVLGRRVPDDVAVIGFDDSPIAAATQPPMSSVRQPIEDMGREMTRLVISMSTANGHGPQQKILGSELALRASTVALS